MMLDCVTCQKRSLWKDPRGEEARRCAVSCPGILGPLDPGAVSSWLNKAPKRVHTTPLERHMQCMLTRAMSPFVGSGRNLCDR